MNKLPYTIWKDENDQEVRLLYSKPDKDLYRAWRIQKGKEETATSMEFAKPVFEIAGDSNQDIAQKILNTYAKAHKWTVSRTL